MKSCFVNFAVWFLFAVFLLAVAVYGSPEGTIDEVKAVLDTDVGTAIALVFVFALCLGKALASLLQPLFDKLVSKLIKKADQKDLDQL